MIDSKQSGSYYTPQLLADFMVYHVFSKYKLNKDIRILEPSAGDGIFFESLFNNPTFKDRKKDRFRIFDSVNNVKIVAIEKNDVAMKKCKNRAKIFAKKSLKTSFLNEDYLEFWKRDKSKFDLIIGNPPYIKTNRLSQKQIKLCEEIHKSAGLLERRIKNIWPSFLIGCAQALNKNGVLCFVLPAELLQVIYAKELRHFLRETFGKIEIFAFSQLVFDGIEQDVIILLASKQGKGEVSFYQVQAFDDLKKPTYLDQHSNVHRSSLDKWTNYVLSDEDLRFLDSFRDKLQPIRNYCRAEAGIVTAANDFFIVNTDTVEKYGLKRFSKPILQKNSLMQPALLLKASDFAAITKAGKQTSLLAFEDSSEQSLPAATRKYLRLGKELAIHERYKCALRNNWQCVPSIWKSEGFFTKRSNLLPRIVVNDANVFVTDSFYRIRMKNGHHIHDLAFSFFNTLTLIFAE